MGGWGNLLEKIFSLAGWGKEVGSIEGRSGGVSRRGDGFRGKDGKEEGYEGGRRKG